MHVSECKKEIILKSTAKSEVRPEVTFLCESNAIEIFSMTFSPLTNARIVLPGFADSFRTGLIE